MCSGAPPCHCPEGPARDGTPVEGTWAGAAGPRRRGAPPGNGWTPRWGRRVVAGALSLQEHWPRCPAAPPRRDSPAALGKVLFVPPPFVPRTLASDRAFVPTNSSRTCLLPQGASGLSRWTHPLASVLLVERGSRAAPASYLPSVPAGGAGKKNRPVRRLHFLP